jgi:hypothetical protein
MKHNNQVYPPNESYSYTHVKLSRGPSVSVYRDDTLCAPNSIGMALVSCYIELESFSPEDIAEVRANAQGFVVYPLCPMCDEKMRERESEQ